MFDKILPLPAKTSLQQKLCIVCSTVLVTLHHKSAEVERFLLPGREGAIFVPVWVAARAIAKLPLFAGNRGFW